MMCCTETQERSSLRVHAHVCVDMRPCARMCMWCDGLQTHPQVVFSVVEEQPHLAVAVGQEDLLQGDDVGVLQLPQQLSHTHKHT